MRSLLFLSFFAIARLCLAQNEFPIWDGPAPGTENRANQELLVNERYQRVFQPSLTLHAPPQELSNGTAVLVIPGGGYHHVTIYKEGHHIASWLNTLGITAFVLKYRLDPDEALQDASRAIEVIRHRSDDFGIQPDQFGVMGFSAGGHLLLNTVSNANDKTCPDFLVVLYPVIDDIDLQNAFPQNASPTIVFAASDDQRTPPGNAISVYQSVLGAGQPVELHLYQNGGHGFAFGLGKGPVNDWTDRCARWLDAQGLLN
ncbi:alpha/beta hydrolase [Pelagicoccus sp. SDUM812003]|uniref:alpha/beta hydrolase n=1 Tax=Pelagicoccus sp. SDUM812003 TaxID=3041267 RepID=UPI00280FAE5A|nr:alpha/beta hydrolase [Pelagicoccus sp. SDUM812003]MDQ8204446.1 alpha/beta hydrolase [Pelagicoccus sp. SDUM812003]